MDKNIIITKIAEISETEISKVTEDTLLSSLESWDSLANVVFVAFAASECGVQLTADEMFNAVTVGDLVKLVESKK